jgi:hypothetical protein
LGSDYKIDSNQTREKKIHLISCLLNLTTV